MITRKHWAISLLLIGVAIPISAFGQERKWPAKNFFETSLHFTSRGLVYWYAKEQGGAERLTGMPISTFHCQDCHVQTCDACHAKEVNGAWIYSTEQARSQQACFDCHGFGDLKKARESGTVVDVHFVKGMKCMDCHSRREIHGDGKLYSSYQDEGARDAKCENCHSQVADIRSHKVHGNKLECSACHLKEVKSCHNCHLDTRLKEGKSVSFPLQDILFLVNHKGRVKPAACLTFVYQNRSMVEFSPSFSHTVAKEARKCEDCHAAPNLKQIQRHELNPVRFEGGKFSNLTGVFPVLDRLKWNFTFFNYEQGRWTPISDTSEPLIQYSGYCTPLTLEQLQRLEKPQSSK